jgi:hypothetical protein
MSPDADRPELLRLWAHLSPEDRHIFLRFARLFLEPRLQILAATVATSDRSTSKTAHGSCHRTDQLNRNSAS